MDWDWKRASGASGEKLKRAAGEPSLLCVTAAEDGDCSREPNENVAAGRTVVICRTNNVSSRFKVMIAY